MVQVPAAAFAFAVPDVPASPRLLTTEEAARILTLSVRTLEGMRLQGGGPPFIQVSPRTIRYSSADLDAWLDQRRRRSTSDTGAPGAR